MNFNSFAYLVFLPCAAALFWLAPQKLKNPLLLLLSYGFYMCWQPRFALLLLFATLLTYLAGRLIGVRPRKKRLWLALAFTLGLAALFFYKYYGFFSILLENMMGRIGLRLAIPALDLLLPIGISFFTFQSLGYVMDVYRGKLEPEKNLLYYALFVAFFPQISAGPIGRAPQLLPQLRGTRHFCWDNVPEGLLLILWGMFKKVLVADQLAVLVNMAYGQPTTCSGWQLLLATFCFSIQIYCDFSGYSDIAVGSALLFGIRLMRNFDAPYLSTSVKEFWRRWHISLSSWFRDYLYFPLGGSRKGYWRTLLNIMIVFTVSGLWHGAAMTFVLWGALNGGFQVVSILTEKPRAAMRHFLRLNEDGVLLHIFRILCTFTLISAAWIFFRADTFESGLFILKRILLTLGGRHLAAFSTAALGLPISRLSLLGICMPVLLCGDLYRDRLKSHILSSIPLRTAVYFLLAAAVLLLGSYGSGYDPQEFVYFKF